ncbi:MAG TPA: hypothetical protein VMT15_07940 [Bryobacteraceae bacterium]|nr:hypothetical protein [Bryobacteraceae bacterium]
MSQIQRVLEKWAVIFAALFAIVWAILRACLQSVTQDEGDTYFWFASKPASYIWHPFPNNHVLNTAMIWITTRVFPLSSFSLRLPAVLGAAIYSAVCYFLCRGLTSRISIQLSIFVCLVYNPFLLDFMACARGYSLANAFLLAAIAIPLWCRAGGRSLGASCALASTALGLSFAASFSFCFADLAAFLAILAWAIPEANKRSESITGTVAFCLLPGLVVAAALCAYPLAHWPKGEFFYTAHSLKEMARSMIDVSLYRVPRRFARIQLWMPWVLAALAGLCMVQAIMTGFRNRYINMLTAIVALTVTLHWLAYKMDKLPLPMTHTGTFFIPLCTLALGAVAAAPARLAITRWLNQGIVALFLMVACYYLLCLRHTYFQEYADDADTKEVYGVLAKLNHTYGVTDTAMDGLFVAPLSFYRVISRKETFPEFLYVPLDTFPTGKSIYVLHGGYFRDFIKAQKLAIVYHGSRSEVVVAVKPTLVEH